MTRLQDAHAKHAASLLNNIQELVVQAQARGFTSPAASELVEAVDETRTELELARPRPLPGVIHGLLSQAFVLTHELRPQAMKSYGQLTSDQATHLERCAARLMQLADRVLDDLNAQTQTEVE